MKKTPVALMVAFLLSAYTINAQSIQDGATYGIFG